MCLSRNASGANIVRLPKDQFDALLAQGQNLRRKIEQVRQELDVYNRGLYALEAEDNGAIRELLADEARLNQLEVA